MFKSGCFHHQREGMYVIPSQTESVIIFMFLLLLLCSHEVAEVAGLTSFSFGESDDNRYIMLFKKVIISKTIQNRTFY